MPSTKRRGNCYVTCEALYHLLGGKEAGWVPHRVKHEGDTHWFLNRYITQFEYFPVYRKGKPFRRAYKVLVQTLDPTRKQFKTTPDYSKGRGCGFLTKKPSKRARELMEKMLWQ